MPYFCNINGRPGTFSLDELALTMGSERLAFPLQWTERQKRAYVIFSTSCNIRCVYCFQNFEKRTRGKHDDEFLEKNLLSLRNEIDQIVLFGGEPFLTENAKSIVRLLERFDYLSFIAFTNGNFESEYAEILREHAHVFERVVITIDGPKEVHNSRRINAAKNSFETIMSNLELLSLYNVPLEIQVNIDKDNAASLPDFFEFASKSEVLSPLFYLLNPVKYSKGSLEQSELLQLFFLLKESYPLDIALNNRLVENLARLFNHKPLFRNRCGLDSTYVLDLPRGEVYACPQNSCSHIGNLRDHGVIIDKTGLESHLQKIAFKSEECKACSLSVFCPLCCPYAPFEGDCVSLVEELLTFTLSHIESLIGRSLFAGAPSAQTYDVNGVV